MATGPVWPVVCVMGPTASGKTGLAVDLAQRFPVRIISVDSAQVYRGMDIGTAKPDHATRAVAPHHLVDIRDPAEAYSAAQFRDDAVREIERARSEGAVPLLVGGTMLYFRSLQHGLAQLPGSDPAVRARLEHDAAEQGWPTLHRRLEAADPETAARLHPNDAQRILRALEVHAVSGRPLSALLAEDRPRPLPYRFHKWAIAPADRSALHRRIEERFHRMLADGFLEEVAALRARGDLTVNHPAIRAVGYRQAWQHLAGDFDRDELARRGVIATRQFAKRQLTWLRSEPELGWLDPEPPRAQSALARVLERLVDGRGAARR